MPHTQEYLHRIEPEETWVQHNRTKMIRRFFVFILVFLVVWVVACTASAVHVTTTLFRARDTIVGAKASVQAFEFQEAEASLQEASVALESARSVLPFIRSASWVPYVGDSIDSFADVIDSSEKLVEAFIPLVDLGNDLIQLAGISEEYLQEMRAGISPEVTFDDLSTATKRSVLQRLGASADNLDLLVAQIDILTEEIRLLSQSVQVGPLLSVLDPLAEDLEQMQEPLRLLAVAANLLPAFAGLEDSASILLLFLNNEELRPGGGFIGSYGILEMDGGDISHLETTDVYTLDRAVEELVTRTAPDPLQRYNATTQWFFRDSNWSPDFATSAQQSLELFFEEASLLEEGSLVPHTQEIDHVIAFTPTYASDLLTITGPITVGGQTFTSENVADLLEYQVQYGYTADGLPESQRKEILADLVNEMKSRLYALSSQEWPLVLTATELALQEKQMILYSMQEDVQQVLEQVGWSGSLAYTSPDVLMVVDANLASLKSDPAVRRHVTYETYQNSSDQWLGRVSIQYTHTGSFSWKTTRYRTYTRVYLPVGTEFLRVEGSWLNDKTQNPTKSKGPVDIEEELGFTSFGTFTSVEPGAETSLIFEFALADEVVEGIESEDYTLTVFKQVGAQNNALTVDLNFGKNVTHATPSEDQNEWGDSAYRLNTILDQDLQIHVSL